MKAGRSPAGRGPRARRTDASAASPVEGAGADEPFVSVVVPVFNAEATLAMQLEALAGQTYRGPWELIVADNGSADASRRVAERYLGRFASMRVADASRRGGSSFARNIGAAAARGKLLAFCDADDVVAPGWLEAIVGALERCDFVAGGVDDVSLNRGLPASWFRLRPEPADPTAGSRFLPYAQSCNVAITRRAYDAVGGFDEGLMHGQDKDFSWRVQTAGFPLHFAPDALVAYRRRRSELALWRQYSGYGRSHAALYKRYRASGHPPSSLRGALGAYGRLLVTSWELLSRERRGAWLRSAAIRWGRILGSIRERTLYL